MTYKGKYRPTNISKYKGDPTNVIYRSGWERYCFSWLDNNPNIKEWSSEEVVVPYYYDVDKSIIDTLWIYELLILMEELY